MRFESLALCEPLLRSLEEARYREATPIQQAAIPKVLTGRDVLGCAQTGTGKTAAFTLPTLQRLTAAGATGRRQQRGARDIRALILTPTRELAGQIGESLATYGKHTHIQHTVIFGGVRQNKQVRALQSGVDVLVATPGRLLDLMQQGFIDLTAVEVLILDEADQMLDMGFIHDLRKIVAGVPKKRQTLMFSATMPQQIRTLADQWLRNPVEVKVAPVASTPERVSQAVCFVERQEKAATLTQFLNDTPRSRTLVFSRTKYGADKITRRLNRDGIQAVAIHGNKSQSKRQAAMRDFNSQSPPVLVATDLAARGLDFSDISHVVNYDMPDTPETYVHRIGRTARAGASGQAISFCRQEERQQLRLIERLTGQAISKVQLLGSTAEQTKGNKGAPNPRPSDDGAEGATTNRPRHGSQRRTRQGQPRPSGGAAEQNRQSPRKTSRQRKRRKTRTG